MRESRLVSDEKVPYFKYAGECTCGWRGGLRVINSDAIADLRRHCAETGCVSRHETEGTVLYEDELMPHERAKLARESERS